MPRVNSSSFTWTTEEIRTKSGFLVGPAGQNPDESELSYLVLRVDDERSSKLCKDIEQMSNSNGGIIIRGSSITADDALAMGFSSSYHTGLFHDNCRCRLVIKPKALYGAVDELDFMMAAGSTAISYSQQYRARKNLEAPIFQKAQKFEYKAALHNVISNNFNNKNNILNSIKSSFSRVGSFFNNF